MAFRALILSKIKNGVISYVIGDLPFPYVLLSTYVITS